MHQSDALSIVTPAAAVELRKATKILTHFDNCQAEWITFQPLVVETFGGWDKDTISRRLRPKDRGYWVWQSLSNSSSIAFQPDHGREIKREHEYIEQKYAPLVADLAHDFRVYQFSLEVSARGFITKENKARPKAFLLRVCYVGNSEMKELISFCSKASLLASFSIFSARNEPSCSSPQPLLVQK